MTEIRPTMNKVEFTVPGEPCPWTVWTRRGPKPVGFEKMEAWQEAIQVAAIQACGGKPLWDGMISLEMDFFRGIPASAPKRPAALKAWVQRHITRKPDWLNYFKAAEDALQGLVITNDSHVIEGHGRKWYTQNEPYTRIKVQRWPDARVRPGDMDGVEGLLKC